MFANSKSRKIQSVIAQQSGTIGSIGFTVPTGCVFEGVFSHSGAAPVSSAVTVYGLNNGSNTCQVPTVAQVGGGASNAGAQMLVLGAGTWTGVLVASAYQSGTAFSVHGVIYKVN